jgi:hypothetical protein
VPGLDHFAMVNGGPDLVVKVSAAHHAESDNKYRPD